MTYCICYYRDETTVQRYQQHAPQLFKPLGWCVGRDRFTTQFEAQKLANHINEQHPVVPAYVKRSNDPATVQMFRTMVRRT